MIVPALQRGTLAAGAASTRNYPCEHQRIIDQLTLVRIQRADAVRAKLAELDLSEQDINDAVTWARQSIKEPTAE